MSESIDIRELNALIEQQSSFVTNLVTGMNQVIVGQKHLVESLLISLLSDGHILLEGVPGLAKTLAIKTLSQLIDADYSRIQFTPDLLPADVVGTLVYSQKDENFHVKKGPVFANFVLADEINRAPAKVQSALLEAMQEHQVTIGEQTFALPKPFLVMATQNPIEQEGTYQLPEAQVDRFMLKVVIGYPTLEEEKLIIRQNIRGEYKKVTPVTTAEEIMKARSVVEQVYIDEKIEQYIADIVFASRFPEKYGLGELKDLITFGGSPRASISLAKAARAYAFIKRRGYVVPEDVRAVAHDVMRHRIGLSYEAASTTHTAHHLIVGNIIAHIHHLLVGQRVFAEQFLISHEFHSSPHVDVLHSKTFVSFAHSGCVAPCDYRHAQSALAGKLYGISVLDVHRAQRFTFCRERDSLSRKHTVHVKHHSTYFLQIVVYHCFCFLFSIIIFDIILYTFFSSSSLSSMSKCLPITL